MINKKEKKSFKYFVKSELAKVDWPKYDVVFQGSILILCVVIFFVSFVACLDLGFTNILNLIKR